MTGAPAGTPPGDGPRHSAGFYRRTLGERIPPTGDKVLIRCVDGPRRAVFESFPPRLELPHHGGVYVLVDDGPVHAWTYRFVTASSARRASGPARSGPTG